MIHLVRRLMFYRDSARLLRWFRLNGGLPHHLVLVISEATDFDACTYCHVLSVPTRYCFVAASHLLVATSDINQPDLILFDVRTRQSGRLTPVQVTCRFAAFAQGCSGANHPAPGTDTAVPSYCLNSFKSNRGGPKTCPRHTKWSQKTLQSRWPVS